MLFFPTKSTLASENNRAILGSGVSGQGIFLMYPYTLHKKYH
jgi:hypothetical protein